MFERVRPPQRFARTKRRAPILSTFFVAGLAVAGCGPGNTVLESNVAEATQALSSLPAPWTDGDIGTVGLAGSATLTSGTFSVKGAGADIWGTTDAFHFAYQRLNGNTQVIAKVASVSNTNAWAKAGVMIRDTLLPNSRNAFVAVTPSNGVTFQSRVATAGSTVSTVATGLVAPYWVKLARSGNRFSAYRSADGVTSKMPWGITSRPISNYEQTLGADFTNRCKHLRGCIGPPKNR